MPVTISKSMVHACLTMPGSGLPYMAIVGRQAACAEKQAVASRAGAQVRALSVMVLLNIPQDRNNDPGKYIFPNYILANIKALQYSVERPQ
jgi:hypothetical protein